MLPASLLAIALLLQFHPYHGIWHDAVIYAGQSLARLYPAALRHDLFFAYGSQDSFSLFPSLLAALVARSSLDQTFLWLTVLGLLAFPAASWTLLRTLLPRSRFAGLLALLLLPASYGAWGILSYAEPFLTARSFAEPLCLAGLAVLLRGRYWLAAALCCVAALLHPLQTLPVLVISWLWLLQSDRRWLHLLWMPLLAGLSCVLVPQLRFLLAPMDPLWFQQVWHRNLVVFYSHSGSGDWSYLLKDLFVAVVALRYATEVLRRYLLSMLGAFFLLFCSGLLLADTLHLAWPAGLQLWRVHWVLHWTATALLPWVLLRLWRDPAIERPRLLVFASAVLLGLIPAAASPFAPVLMALFVGWQRMTLVSPRLRTTLALLCGMLALDYLMPQLLAYTPLGLPPGSTPWTDAVSEPRLPALLALPIALAALWLWRRRPSMHWLGLPVVAVLLTASSLHWDQRGMLQIAFTEPHSRSPFGVEMPVDAQVVWLGNLLPAWSVLHRSYYIQQQQLAGIVFNRATSVEGYRRKDLLTVHDGAGRECRIVVFAKEPYTACKPDDFAVREACMRTRGALTHFVLYYPLRMRARAVWIPGNGTVGRYYLYACMDFIQPRSTGPASLGLAAVIQPPAHATS